MRSFLYSLEFELERFRPLTMQRLIVPVDREGRSPYCRAHDRSKRVVDLVPGIGSCTTAVDTASNGRPISVACHRDRVWRLSRGVCARGLTPADHH